MRSAGKLVFRMRTDLSTDLSTDLCPTESNEIRRRGELLSVAALSLAERKLVYVYDPAEGHRAEGRGYTGRVRTRAIGGQLNRTKLNPDRFLIRPYALAGSPKELLFAGLCIMLLGAVFGAEILTPDVVVGGFAIMPLLAALWVLSSRLAALVAIVATLFFGAAIAVETANRMTVILLGVAVFGTALMGRLCATGLASVLSSRHHMRPSIRSWVTPATLGGMDSSSYGLRSLTRRELEVARLAAEGYTAAEIGRRLNIGDRTVESHLASAYSKLRIRSRLQLIRMASRLGTPP
jgi:DNA-binding CsgD family transcriptional regulator